MKDEIIVEQCTFEVIGHCKIPVIYEKKSTWVARQLVSGHVQQAEKIKMVHREEIKRIVSYMLDILNNRTNYIEMFEVMQYAISALGYDKESLTTIIPEQYGKMIRKIPYNRRK